MRKSSKKLSDQEIGLGASGNETKAQLITFPFSDFFEGSNYTNSKKNISIFNSFEAVSDMFLSLSKTAFAPWEVFLQHAKSGVMLHFYHSYQSSGDPLPIKKLTIFCPFLFGAPYKFSFSVYVLGKQIDKGFLPYCCFENELMAQKTVTDLLDTLFSLQPCLGIYDENFLRTIKMRQQQENFVIDSTTKYEIDSKFLLTNHYGQEIKETIRSINPDRLCACFLCQPRAERCQNCTLLLKNIKSIYKETPSDKCSFDSHAALSKLSFEQLIERYQNLKKSCKYWKLRTRHYMKEAKIKPPQNFKTSSTKLGNLVDTAVQENLLKENSVLYLLMLDAIIGLQKQEKEFTKSNTKLTKTKQKPKAKGMRFHPLVIKWCCSLASKCREKDYESIRSILPVPHWQTIKQYRQTDSSSEPINHANLKRMTREMERRNCKGIGGIHWDEMIIQEGIVVCKRTGEPLGF